MGARGYDIFEARKFDICAGSNKAQWFFCQRSAPVSENEFARDYKGLTGQSDLEHADVNRNTRGFVIPSLLMGIGVVGVGVSATSLVLTYVTQTQPFPSPSPLSRSLPFGLDLGIGAALVGIGFGAWGIWELTNSLRYVDDPAEAHTITEAEGRKAADRYNTALAEQINKELGASP
jgi:hypothetical protein